LTNVIENLAHPALPSRVPPGEAGGMASEIQTMYGRCAMHGEVQATREIPGMGFPMIVYAIRRRKARRAPFACPACGSAVTPL
jgi:hypothetical protein